MQTFLLNSGLFPDCEGEAVAQVPTRKTRLQIKMKWIQEDDAVPSLHDVVDIASPDHYLRVSWTVRLP
jgi:hypothetical protein